MRWPSCPTSAIRTTCAWEFRRFTRRSPISTRRYRESRASCGSAGTSGTRPSAPPSPEGPARHLGTAHTMGTPYDYQTDWARVAHLIVHDALRLGSSERVLIHADPTYFPALTEAVRVEVNRAGAVELAVHMLHPPGLERVRRELRRREDPTTRAMEDRSAAALFALADAYIWLPTSWAYNVMQTEEIIKSWPGRAIHFHWIMDVSMDAGLFRRLSELYDAALWVDYAALTAHQRRVVAALQDSEIEITDPRGTRLRFELRGAHFHLGNGDASRAFIDGYARRGSARDRAGELPAGAIRTADIERTEGVLVTPPESFAGHQVGQVRLEFAENRITKLAS